MQWATAAQVSTVVQRSSATGTKAFVKMHWRYRKKALHYDSSLGVRFYRNISFEVGGDLGANVVLLATLVTSRRHERLSGDNRLASDPSVKFAQVDHAIHNVGRGAAPVPKPADIELSDFLKTTS